MYTITVSEKGGQQSTFEFNKPEVTIGRMKGNDIVLPKGNVSKRHSRIFAQEGAFRIIDLDSTNGTYVNGRKITGEQPITESDKVYIGDFILQVEPDLQAAGGPKPPAPPGGPAMPAGPNGGSGPAEPVPNEPPRPNMPSQPRIDGAPKLQSSPALNFDDLNVDVTDDSAGPPDMGHGPSAQPQNTPAPPNGAGAPSPNAGPGPRPGPPEAPKLPSSTPPRNDDVTVDRAARPVGGGRPEYSQVSALLSVNDLESEFDADYHAAKQDVATVLFENVSPQDLPMHYPPSPEDSERFRTAVEQAVNTVSPGGDRDALIDAMTQECVGLGPVGQFLDDETVQDIYVNRWDYVLVRRDGALVRARETYSHPALLLAAAHRMLGQREVLTDEIRLNDGTRVHVILPPLAPDGAAITVRKPPSSFPRLENLVGDNALSSGMADFLSRAVEAGRSILIAGPTGSGRTTLLSALTQQMPPGVRIVAIENGSHLALPENSVRLEPNASTGFDPRYLVHSAMSMHPQRIILDECRGPEAYDWVTAAACGTEGSIATVHGTSAAESLGRLESLCLMGANNLSPRGLREQVARAVNLVVVVNRTAAGKVRVQQITEVQGVDLDAYRLNDVFYFRVEGAGGGFHPTGYVPLFYEDLRHAGVDVDLGIFRE